MVKERLNVTFHFTEEKVPFGCLVTCKLPNNL